jgi:carboxypeptidase C (cathepsin A)
MEAVIKILRKFEEIMNNDLYFAGEEYAGILVPMLAQKIEEWNFNCTITKKCDIEPNLKGIIVGNGLTDFKYDNFDSLFD